MTAMRSDRSRAVRICAYVLLLLAMFLLQHSRGTAVVLWQATADGIPFFLATLALLEGPYVAGSFGFFAGLLLALHTTTVEGLSALYLGLFGILFGLLGTYYMRPVLPSALLGGTVCIAVQGVLRYVFYYLLVYHMDALTAGRELLAEWLLALPSGVLLWFVIGAIRRRFQEKET
jgi:hypothetical protein